MEFTVKKYDLLAELNLTQGVVERKTTIPILSHLLCEAKGNRLRRKTGGVFHTVKALFFNGRHQPAVAHQRRGRVAVIRVDSKNIHRSFEFIPPAASPRMMLHGRSCGRLRCKMAPAPFPRKNCSN